MIRARRAVAVLLAPAVLALGACAGRGPGEPADLAAIARYAAPAGVAPELVYVTDVEGFDLATQSVGVVGDDGMSAVYVRTSEGSGGSVMLTTSRVAAPDVVPCAELADSAAPDAVLRCDVVRGQVHVLLEGDGVEPATLRSAGQAVRVPGTGELSHLFADVQVVDVPVERGDLPAEGDGAPMNEPGPGG